MRWLPWASKRTEPTVDPRVATLAARADEIMEELDVVVRQMSEMLRERAEK